MLVYKNIKKHINVPFDNYLKIGGYSFSFLKREYGGQLPEFKMTDKVELGALVDAILMQGDKINFESPQISNAFKIARYIKNEFRDLLTQFESQVSYTGIISYEGIEMPTCGRLDWLLPNHAVIDLKVTDAKTDKQFSEIIRFMKYDAQLFNYRNLANVRQSFILPYSTVAKSCLSIVKMEYSPNSEKFWTDCVIKFGK